MGDNVESIGERAFAYCPNLTNVEMSNSVKIIWDSAFSSCDLLERIYIPISVTNIGGWAFYNCPNLTIYCESLSELSTWHWFWNNSNCPVVWGYKEN